MKEKLMSRRKLGVVAILLLAICFLGVTRAQGVESLGYKLHKISSMFGPKHAITGWLKKNPSTEIVSFAIDKSNNIYIITK